MINNWKSIKTFSSHNGKHYSNGIVISDFEYNNLFYSEKENFVKNDNYSSSINDEDDDSTSLLNSVVTGLIIEDVIEDLSFNNTDNTSNDNNSIDFGGGDFGGGGASGDW